MPKPTKGPRLGGSPAHQRIILANLASQLFVHGRITTTESKAKRVQPLAEHLITKAKRGDLHARRTVLKTITSPDVVHVLFTEIAPTMAERDGGYTRITKLGARKGDGAALAVIELITEPVAKRSKPKSKSKRPAKPTPEETTATSEPTTAASGPATAETEAAGEADTPAEPEADVTDGVAEPAPDEDTEQ